MTTTSLRVCIVGSGPSAFYAAEALFKQHGERVHVDMIDRLPVPFGLVRGGVAPDHQNIKGVVKVYQKIAENPGFHFFGNVKLGRDLQVDELQRHYHQIVYAFGCESDLKLGVAGEELGGVHSATEFVGWYNGHPDHRDRRFDLANARRVALVGNGNVAMDVARVLLHDADALANTDIAEHALAVLRQSKVEEVILLGRRGPAQAAFSPKEIEEIAELPHVSLVVGKPDVTLDELSGKWLETEAPRSAQRNVKFLQEHADRPADRPRRLVCRFLVGPVALLGTGGKVSRVRIQHMQLVADPSGTPRAKPIDKFEELDVDLVFKAIGYRGVPVPGVPFEERKGTVPNLDGRVLENGAPRPGEYVVGWAKRGPTGLIGTNSPDSKATVEAMIADHQAGKLLPGTPFDLAAALRARNIDFVSWQDWQRLDADEQARGQAAGKVRIKEPSVEALLARVQQLRR